jgi:hypothetical protein
MTNKLSPDVVVISQVITERKRQDMQWGGPEHDDTHETSDWIDYMAHQVERTTPHTGTVEQAKSDREMFIKIAALAVAAVESLDRKAKQ